MYTAVVSPLAASQATFLQWLSRRAHVKAGRCTLTRSALIVRLRRATQQRDTARVPGSAAGVEQRRQEHYLARSFARRASMLARARARAAAVAALGRAAAFAPAQAPRCYAVDTERARKQAQEAAARKLRATGEPSAAATPGTGPMLVFDRQVKTAQVRGRRCACSCATKCDLVLLCVHAARTRRLAVATQRPAARGGVRAAVGKARGARRWR